MSLLNKQHLYKRRNDVNLICLDEETVQETGSRFSFSRLTGVYRSFHFWYISQSSSDPENISCHEITIIQRIGTKSVCHERELRFN